MAFPYLSRNNVVKERGHDSDRDASHRALFAGDPIRAADVNDGLRAINQKRNYPHAPKKLELPPQQTRFVLKLLKAAGYRGWVILLDELELVGNYSILQAAPILSLRVGWVRLRRLTPDSWSSA